MFSDGKGWVNMVKYSNTHAECRKLNILADTMKDGVTPKGNSLGKYRPGFIQRNISSQYYHRLLKKPVKGRKNTILIIKLQRIHH
ncbi:hypothetical protein C0033_05550 [Clostridium sp. chh4-2]|nr:hypothetical protein C0033_05550 [Clostridium sp. chh4-2]